VYGVFRFMTEFIRETPKDFGNLSGYQLISLVMVPWGGVPRNAYAGTTAAWREFQRGTNAAGGQVQPVEVSHVQQ